MTTINYELTKQRVHFPEPNAVISHIKKELESFGPLLDDIMDQIDDFEITGQSDAEKAVKLLATAKILNYKLGGRIRHFLMDAETVVKQTKGEASVYTNKISSIDNNLRSKLEEWINSNSNNTELKNIRTETGTAYFNKKWGWNVDSFEELPDQYKVINSTALSKAVDAGMRNIPGVSIFETTKMMVRT